jgi:hypothetical protein
MAHVVTLSEQLETVTQAIRPLIDRQEGDDPEGANGQCKAAIAECEALVAMLNEVKSQIEYEILEQCPTPDPYWD